MPETKTEKPPVGQDRSASVADEVEPTRVSIRARIGRVLGPVLAIAVYFLLPGGAEGVSDGGRGAAAVAVLMAIWWLTEALPLPATALLPLVLFPMLGVSDIDEAAAPYANDLIFLFLGGFALALAMQRWGLHSRIALRTVLAIGTKPGRVIGGFMLATGFLSMWISNTATTVMMLPVGLSITTLVLDRVDQVRPSDNPESGRVETVDANRSTKNFATSLMLGIAYAASIGSMATLIGTPPNIFMAGFLADNYGIHIGFAQWMSFGLPFAVILLTAAWLLLTKVIYRSTLIDIPDARALFRNELAKLGPMSRGERIVATVFACAALLWIVRDPLSNLPGLSELSDAGIAIAAALVLFAIPVDNKKGVFVLNWSWAARLPWGVLILLGGGYALADAISSTGLDEFLGRQLGGLGGLPTVALVVVIVLAVLLLTELNSNTATVASFVPILAAVAVGLNVETLLLVVPATVAASCAFMMPIATPPNAIVFGTGHVTLPQMVRAGVWLNLLALVLIPVATFTLAAMVFGLSF